MPRHQTCPCVAQVVLDGHSTERRSGGASSIWMMCSFQHHIPTSLGRGKNSRARAWWKSSWTPGRKPPSSRRSRAAEKFKTHEAGASRRREPGETLSLYREIRDVPILSTAEAEYARLLPSDASSE
jgi:hypothetical protein